MKIRRALARYCALAAAALSLSACGTDDLGRMPDTRSVWRADPTLSNKVSVYYLTDRASNRDRWGCFAEVWADQPASGVETLAFELNTHSLEQRPSAVIKPGPSCERQPSGHSAEDLLRAITADHCSGLLLYVHGFNTTFETGVVTAAQVARDTRAPCVAVFSFASEGLARRYALDVEHSAYAVPLLARFLSDISETNIRLTVLAHSMGNRVALSALALLRANNEVHRRDFVAELVLAAADVDSTNYDKADPYADDFGRLIADAVRDTDGLRYVHRVTIYASAGDAALAVSEGLHDGPRAGRQPLDDLRYEQSGKVDVVDATDAPGDELGHGYFSKSYEALGDITMALAGHSRGHARRSPRRNVEGRRGRRAVLQAKHRCLLCAQRRFETKARMAIASRTLDRAGDPNSRIASA